MLSPRWMKVVRDLWSNRTRTILVVASIAVGIFAVGTVQQLSTVVLGEMQTVYSTSNASHATILASGLDDDMIESIEHMPEVAVAEGRGNTNIKVEVTPGQWEPLALYSIPDFEEMPINTLSLVDSVDGHEDFGAEAGRWPTKDEIVLERSSLDTQSLPAGLTVGDSLRVETVDGKIRDVTVSGAVYDPTGFPAAFTGSGTGFVTQETFERLGGPANYAQVDFVANGAPEQLADKAYLEGVNDDVVAKIERSGRSVQISIVQEPGELPLQDLFDAITLLLTPLGLLALALSSFLVINTISALMSQQVRQIGVMKSVGARRGQIVAMYLSSVLIYSLLALAVAIPLTAVVSSALAQFLGGFINVTFPALSIPTNILLLEVVVGVGVPLLAALYPVYRGTSVTVREAISDYGLGKGQFGADRFTRLLGRIRGISRPMQLSLRNTFRRRSRLIMTLITLTLGGMLFMTVGSIRLSLGNLIDEALAYNQFDIQIQFERNYRTAQIEQVVANVPGVIAAESWGSGSATYIRGDGSDGDQIAITSLPAESEMVQPTLVEGRWLLPDDENAIVLTQSIVANEPDIALGDTVTLEIDDKNREFVVVGVAQVFGGPSEAPAYVNLPYFSKLTGDVGRAGSVQVTIEPEGILESGSTLEALQTALEEGGIRVASVFTIAQIRAFTGAFFDIIVYLLLAMGVLIASVGALGLMGTMSTNVLERTREIGVMRAIGASDWAIQRIVIVEGLIIGLISWGIGALLAYPVGLALTSAVGTALFQITPTFVFSASGLFTWLGIVIALAAVASFLPAWNASRLTVREVLAYE